MRDMRAFGSDKTANHFATNMSVVSIWLFIYVFYFSGLVTIVYVLSSLFLKDGILIVHNWGLFDCFTYRNAFQNGANDDKNG